MRPAPVAPNTAAEITREAAAFLATLNAEQRAQATFDFSSDERLNWHYVPRPRLGLPRGEMDAAQLEAADSLMASGLSPAGFKKAKDITQLELILGRIERDEGEVRFDRNPDLYFFSVFGGPGGNEPWGWRVDGHHLSLNFTVVDGDILSPTPSFFGANPAEVKQGPQKGLRILREEEDLAKELFLSLEPDQRDLAVIYRDAPSDIITRAGRRVDIAERVGLPAELMSAGQRQLLISLLKVYIERKPPDVAQSALRKVEEEGLNNILFGWAGSHRRGQRHYYRIHGPSFFVEYDNTQNMANHIHSVWRDITGDFGFDVLQAHYQQHHSPKGNVGSGY